MKILQKICFVLLLGTFSSAYGGDCFKDKDVDDCREKAEQGIPLAQSVLGYMYNEGIGVPQDYKESVKWYRKAAEQRFAEAQLNLGLMYVKGQGVLQDYVMAHMYWNIAAVSGAKDAIKNRGLIEKEMTATQIEKAQDLARDWVSKH